MTKETRDLLTALQMKATSLAKKFHRVSRDFENSTKRGLYLEWAVFDRSYGDVLNLKEDASEADVKHAISRLKRAAANVRDALERLCRFSIPEEEAEYE